MTEDEITSTGQFPALGSADFASSYHAPDIVIRQSGTPTPAAQVAAAATGLDSLHSGEPATDEEVKSAIAAANANLASSDRTLDYQVDAATGISIATIRNAQTGAVLQQMPGTNIIALARMLAEWSPGKHMLLDLIA
jgi:uncharacterized FlaG/YvyC family protein